MESSRARDASSSSGKPKKPPKKVIFDHARMPVGPGSGKPATSLGSLTRSQISVKYETWKLVPDETKDQLWKNFKEEFNFRDTQRKDQMKKADMAWRRYKTRLRFKHFKGKTLQSWLDSIPPRFVPEDWRAFCVREYAPKARAQRRQNKKNRNNSASRGTHTSGRDGYSRTAWKFKQKHGRRPTRIELWLCTHKRRKTGDYAPHDVALARKFEEFLQLMQDTNDEQPLDSQRMIATFGKNIEARTRCIGSTISNSSWTASSFAREMLEEVEDENDGWKIRLENIEATNAMLVSKVDELIEGMRSGKLKSGANQEPSGDTSINPGSSNPLPEPTQWEILGWGKEVVAIGTRTSCGTGGVVHGHKLGPSEAKVLIDEIIDHECPLWGKRQGCATTLMDVGVGGFVYWDDSHLAPRYD